MEYADGDVARLRIALGRIARQVDRQVSNDGMPRTQLSVLATVAVREQVGMGELAEHEGVNPTMLSRVVGRLESEGLVSRTPDPDDRRIIRVAITAAGASTHARLRRERTRLLAARLAELPAAQARALLGALPALEGLAESLRGTPAAAARR